MPAFFSVLNPSLVPYQQAKRWIVAFSGGLDSTVLLHLLSQARPRPPILAVYIHHGLQAVADEWQSHCEKVAANFQVEFQALKVDVSRAGSMEDEARKARYQAFAALMQQGDVLFMGHHGNDQLETMLFRLFRGTGLRGLKGIPPHRPFQQGLIARPLLAYSRAQLNTYAQQHLLTFVEDPSNASTEHDRNYIRQKLVPIAEQRWPQAAEAALLSAEHLSEGQNLLDEIAEEDLQRLSAQHWGMPCLDTAAWHSLSVLRQKNSLRYWLYQHDIFLSHTQWQRLLDDMVGETVSTTAEIKLSRWIIRRYKQYLYLCANHAPAPLQEQEWITTEALRIEGFGHYVFEPSLVICLQIKPRQGGEKLLLQENRPRQRLKEIFQAHDVPPWLRDSIPLLYFQDELIAVGHLAFSAKADSIFQHAQLRFIEGKGFILPKPQSLP